MSLYYFYYSTYTQNEDKIQWIKKLSSKKFKRIGNKKEKQIFVEKLREIWLVQTISHWNSDYSKNDFER